MKYEPQQTNTYHAYQSLKDYGIPPLTPNYILSPFYTLALPYGPSESSIDHASNPLGNPSSTPLDVITNEFLQPTSTDPLDQFLSHKRRFLAQSVEDILGLIYEREQLKYDNHQKIDFDSTKIGTRLFEVDYWRAGSNPNIDKVRSNLERELFAMEKEKRMEEVACWRDIARLRTDLREVMREVSQETRRTNLLSGE